MLGIGLIKACRLKVSGISWTALVGFVCLAFASLCLGQQTFVGTHGRLSVKGNKIVDRNGTPTTLHGMSLYCWAPQGKKFFNTTAIGHLAHDWKCTVIRIAVLPRDYKNNPTDELNRVKTVIDACIENGIYAIIDWHSMGGAQNDVASAQSFFSALATAYGRTPNVMYEPWNEPVQESWDVIKAYHEALLWKPLPNGRGFDRTARTSQDVDASSLICHPRAPPAPPATGSAAFPASNRP